MRTTPYRKAGRRPEGAAALAFAVLAAPALAQAPQAPAPQAPAPATPTPGTTTQPAPPAASLPGVPGGTAAATTPQMLSLDEAVQRAVRQSPTLDEAVAALRRAEAVVAEARSFELPRLDGTARFALQGPIPSFVFTTPASPGQPPRTQSIAFGKTFTRNFSLDATYDPDPFGRLGNRRRSLMSQINVSRAGYFTAQNELVYAVQNVYLAGLRSQELVNVQREALEAAQEQLRVAQAQFRAGTAPEFDVLRAQVQVENVRQNLVTAEAGFRRTAAGLTRLLSLDAGAPLQLAPVAVPPESEGVAGATARGLLEPKAGTTPEPLPRTLEATLAEAFTRRPEVYSAEWSRRAAQLLVQYEKKGRLPSVGITASGFYAPDQAGLAPVTKSWSIIANVSIPIWDAGLTRARTRQAQADVAAANARLQGARDSVAEDVKTALVDLEDASQRRQAAGANVAQAREALRIARVRYSAGLAPNVEVTDAEAALTQARANEVNAAYDYLNALASLNRSLGVYASDALASLHPSAPAVPPAAPVAGTHGTLTPPPPAGTPGSREGK